MFKTYSLIYLVIIEWPSAVYNWSAIRLDNIENVDTPNFSNSQVRNKTSHHFLMLFETFYKLNHLGSSRWFTGRFDTLSRFLFHPLNTCLSQTITHLECNHPYLMWSSSIQHILAVHPIQQKVPSWHKLRFFDRICVSGFTITLMVVLLTLLIWKWHTFFSYPASNNKHLQTWGFTQTVMQIPFEFTTFYDMPS